MKDSELLHPRYMLDLICIADVATFKLDKVIQMGPKIDEERRDAFGDDPEGGVETSYTATEETEQTPYDSRGHVLAALVGELTSLLAFEDSSLRPFAGYLGRTDFGGGIGEILTWTPGVLSDAVRERLILQGCEEDMWSKWQRYF